MMSRLATQLSCKKAHFCDRHHRASAMAGLASYLSIEPHMRSFDGFPTLPNSAPLARGLFFAARPPASRELFPPSEPRRLGEQARDRDHHSRDPYGQTRKQQKIAQERRHIAPPLYLPCACPSCHSKDLAFVRCPTHGPSQIVSRLPQDLAAYCVVAFASSIVRHAMARARPHAHSLVMNVAPFAIYLVVLGLLLATMLVALTVWLVG